MPGKPIELEGSPYLEDEQNFYDQLPFREVIDVNNLDIDLSYVRKAVTRTCRYAGSTTFMGSEVDLNIKAHRLVIKPYLTLWRLKSSIRSDIKRSGAEGSLVSLTDQCLKAVADVTAKLIPYPSWVEYVVIHLSSNDYSEDGIRRSQSNREFLHESYLSWASRGQRNRKILRERGILVGIEEVFPQDFADSTLMTLPIEPGRKPVNVRWKMLRAAEITKDR